MLRIAVMCILIIALFGSLVWFDSMSPSPELGVPPTESNFVGSYDRFVGQRVLADGTVTSSDPLKIRVSSEKDEIIELKIIGHDRVVSRGDGLSVYGVLETKNRIKAINIIHKPRAAQQRTYVVSFIAGLWVVGRLVRHWQPNQSRLIFEPRNIPADQWLWERLRSETTNEDRDA